MRRWVAGILAWLGVVACYKPLDFTGNAPPKDGRTGDAMRPDAPTLCPVDAAPVPGDSGLIDSGQGTCIFASLADNSGGVPSGWNLGSANNPPAVAAVSGSAEVVLSGTFDQSGQEAFLEDADTQNQLMVSFGSVEVQVTSSPTADSRVALVMTATSDARMEIGVDHGRLFSEFHDADGSLAGSDNGECAESFSTGYIRIVLEANNRASTEWSTDGKHWVPELAVVPTPADGNEFADTLVLTWTGSGSGSASVGLANFTLSCMR
jgi:hypothetical protein